MLHTIKHVVNAQKYIKPQPGSSTIWKCVWLAAGAASSTDNKTSCTEFVSQQLYAEMRAARHQRELGSGSSMYACQHQMRTTQFLSGNVSAHKKTAEKPKHEQES